ncbi:Rrf2 family transcriptional regulator [Coraliomargarita sinensis]|uniref:Rrf2 family transcriptional regulator n=1 Tax=Coraliomargarita sinensis TaxID=2174842 RepID=A0A317ZFC2_9BACT|nr:Rrf2 family transcriptional regulator [Coraliomargarita sinensis]PXA03562.1 Rrf2 family transcriptional regulator [Coraliomargarita sinensis]
MLSLSQGVGYAVKALAYVDDERGSGQFVRDIAEQAEVPPSYLAKIFKRLVDSEVLVSKRGWAGGTRLARSPESITLLEIAEAVDGKDWNSRCLLGQEICSDERACPTHDFWKVERKAIAEKLKRITLAECIDFERERALKKHA